MVFLKTILVCVYGTSGCCWNRFGNVLAFEEINRRSRQTLIMTKDYVQSRGFKLIYADTDSVFVKKDGATKEDYERLAEQLSNLTGLPISLDHHYKFLTLLPLEEDANMKAQKHYFGTLYSGEIVARGIELKRHDTPEFIRNFQAELIKTLLDCRTLDEVYSIGYERALTFVKKAVDKIMNEKMSLQERGIENAQESLQQIQEHLPTRCRSNTACQQRKNCEGRRRRQLHLQGHRTPQPTLPHNTIRASRHQRKLRQKEIL